MGVLMLLENGKDRNELVFFSKSSHYKKTERAKKKRRTEQKKGEKRNILATMQKKITALSSHNKRHRDRQI